MPAQTNIVSVTTNVRDVAAKAPSFNTLAIVGKHANFPEPRPFATGPAGLAAMVAAGFSASGADPIYQAAAACASVSGGVDQVLILNRAGDSTDPEYTLTPNLTGEKRVPGFKINGSAVSHTNGAAETATTIATAITALAGALPGTDATDTTGALTLAPTTAGERLHITSLIGFTLEETTTLGSDVADIATDLTAGLAEAPFYGFYIADATHPDVLMAASAWAESNKRLMVGSVLDTANISAAQATGGADLGNQHKDAGRHRTGFNATRHYDHKVCGFMSRQLAQQPGTSNWSLKALVGGLADAFTETEYKNAQDKKLWTYCPYEDVGGTWYGGRAASNRPFYITRGVDWLDATLKAAVLTALLNAEKVDFTLGGFGIIEAAIRATLQTAEDRGLIIPGWTVTMPDLSTISKATKVNGILENVKWAAVSTGGVDAVTINGDFEV